VDEVQIIADFAKKLFLKDGYHIPLLLVKGTGGRKVVGLQEFGDTSDKRVQDMLNTGTWLACKHYVGDLELIVFVCEGWIGTNINVRPSQDPNRIEVLQIASLDVRTQEEQVKAFQVKRDPKGTVSDLKELIFPEKVEAKGRLLPAFQKGYQIISPVKH